MVLGVGFELQVVWVMVAAKYVMGHGFSFTVQRYRLFEEFRTLRRAVRLDHAQSLRDGIWRMFILSSSPWSPIVVLLIARISEPDLQIATQSPVTLRLQSPDHIIPSPTYVFREIVEPFF